MNKTGNPSPRKLAALMAATAAAGAAGAVLVLTTGSGVAMAGCSTTFVSQTGSNTSNLPSTYVSPPVYGVSIGKPVAFGTTEAGYTTQAVTCIKGNPGAAW